MATVVTQNKVGVWFQPDGKGTALDIASITRHGAGDITIPRSGRDLVSGRDAYGNPKIVGSVKTPPGGLITGNIEWHKITTPEFLETVGRCNSEFGLWKFFCPCNRIDNLGGWQRLDYFGGMGVTQQVDGAGPALDGSGARVVNNVDLAGLYWVVWVPLSISAQTTTEPEDLNDIAGLKDCLEDCLQGYAGPDEILYAVSDANAGSPGDSGSIIYTVNAGGSWGEVQPPPLGGPFVATENIGDIEMWLISKTQYRVIVGRSTADGGNAAEIAYGDFTFGDPDTTTWTNVDVGTTAGDVIEALAWLFYDRVYAAAGGDIFVSTDQGESFGTAVYTGSTTINAIALDEDDEVVWAVGDSNLILREVAKSSSFETRTGPSGGGTFYSVAIANDGRLYAGNSQYIYVSTNSAENTGGWTQLKDFGTNKTVVAIQLGGQSEVDGGDSQLITAVIDDTSGTDNGEVWRSWDGGNSWRQTTEATNAGYNAAYFSDIDDNLFWIVGDTSGGTGLIHKVSACTNC